MSRQCSNAVDNYPDLEDHHSHMAHCLTEETYERLFPLETISGFKIDDIIQSGVDEPGQEYSLTVGCVAADEESYTVFAEFFDAIIEAYHNGYKPGRQHKRDLEFESDVADLDAVYVTSCDVTARRSVRGFCMPSFCSRAERRHVMKIIGECVEAMSDKGEFCFGTTDDELQSTLQRQLSRDWPDSRGRWRNSDVTVTCNVDDHLCFALSRKDAKVLQAVKTLYEIVECFEASLKNKGHEFMQNEHHGYLTTCPSNLGTALMVEVRLMIPKLRDHPRFWEITTKLRVTATDSAGEVKIGNIDRLGYTEVEIVRAVLDGARFIVECEKRLEKGQKIDFEVNKLRQN